jgi:hypothetical protein
MHTNEATSAPTTPGAELETRIEFLIPPRAESSTAKKTRGSLHVEH